MFLSSLSLTIACTSCNLPSTSSGMEQQILPPIRTTSPFLSLPFEIRQCIYSYCCAPPYPDNDDFYAVSPRGNFTNINVNRTSGTAFYPNYKPGPRKESMPQCRHPHSHQALLITCQQVFDEYYPVYCEHHSIRFPFTPLISLFRSKLFDCRNVASLKHLKLRLTLSQPTQVQCWRAASIELQNMCQEITFLLQRLDSRPRLSSYELEMHIPPRLWDSSSVYESTLMMCGGVFMDYLYPPCQKQMCSSADHEVSTTRYKDAGLFLIRPSLSVRPIEPSQCFSIALYRVSRGVWDGVKSAYQIEDQDDVDHELMHELKTSLQVLNGEGLNWKTVCREGEIEDDAVKEAFAVIRMTALERFPKLESL